VSGERRSDADLVRVLDREPDAICELYDRYVLRLIRSLTAAGGTRESAWDVAQETFARLLEHGHRARVADDGTLWPWLSVTARNLLRDWQRRGRIDERARRRLGIEAVAGDEDELEATLNRLEGQELANELSTALDSLPADQRDAVRARVIDGVQYAPYAAAAGTSEQAVRRRVSRGLHAMRSLLEGGQR
jgi:RNA polymerase sigma-70 factor (ECF subfamily)